MCLCAENSPPSTSLILIDGQCLRPVPKTRGLPVFCPSERQPFLMLVMLAKSTNIILLWGPSLQGPFAWCLFLVFIKGVVLSYKHHNLRALTSHLPVPRLYSFQNTFSDHSVVGFRIPGDPKSFHCLPQASPFAISSHIAVSGFVTSFLYQKCP